MAVKPILEKPLVKPVPYGTVHDPYPRDEEHMELITKVWFSRFDNTFYDDFEFASCLIYLGDGLEFNLGNGIGFSDENINIHPNITKQHLGYLSRKIRGYILKYDSKSAVITLLATNIAIELLEKGVNNSIVQLYFEHLLKIYEVDKSEYYEHLYFNEYKELEEEEEIND